MTVIALATQVPLAVTLEVDLHADTAGLGPSIWSVGLPEELAKAIPVLAVAVIYWLWGRHELTPKDLGYAKVGSGSDLEVPAPWPPASGRHGVPSERPPATRAGATTRPWWEH